MDDQIYQAKYLASIDRIMKTTSPNAYAIQYDLLIEIGKDSYMQHEGEEPAYWLNYQLLSNIKLIQNMNDYRIIETYYNNTHPNALQSRMAKDRKIFNDLRQKIIQDHKDYIIVMDHKQTLYSHLMTWQELYDCIQHLTFKLNYQKLITSNRQQILAHLIAPKNFNNPETFNLYEVNQTLCQLNIPKTDITQFNQWLKRNLQMLHLSIYDNQKFIDKRTHTHLPAPTRMQCLINHNQTYINEIVSAKHILLMSYLFD